MSSKQDPRDEGSVLTRKKQRTREPPMYRVLLHNDDYTPMEFVVAILQQVFHLGEVDATRIMLEVHTTGVGMAGAYPYAIAETKMNEVLAAARHSECPLQCSMEPEC